MTSDYFLMTSSRAEKLLTYLQKCVDFVSDHHFILTLSKRKPVARDTPRTVTSVLFFRYIILGVSDKIHTASINNQHQHNKNNISTNLTIYL
jgi:hypothetical protein